MFSRKERGQGIAGERMTEDQGIKSSTHRDGCALPGTVVYCVSLSHNQHSSLVFHVYVSVCIMYQCITVLFISLCCILFHTFMSCSTAPSHFLLRCTAALPLSFLLYSFSCVFCTAISSFLVNCSLQYIQLYYTQVLYLILFSCSSFCSRLTSVHCIQ